MNIKLLGDRVLVKVEDKKTKTISGIVLPEASQSKSQIAIVRAVGEGRILNDGTRISQGIKKGDRIIFDRFAGTKLIIEDEELLLVNERDVIAILNGEKSV